MNISLSLSPEIVGLSAADCEHETINLVSIRYSRAARRDLLGIWVRLASANERAADALFDRTEQRIQRLRDFPNMGSPRPKIGSGARVLVEPPSLVSYEPMPGGVQIVRVMHAAPKIVRRSFSAGSE
jgi:toxin ParE1/3/4